MPVRISLWIPAYLAVALAWGTGFMFAYMASATFTPFGVTFWRNACAGGTLLVVCVVTRTRLPPRELWGHLVVYSLLIAVLPQWLLVVAVQNASTSLIGILGSMVPVFVLIVNLVFFPEQRPSALRIAGIFVGLGGILVVLGVWNGVGSATLLGASAQLTAGLLWAFAVPYSRRYLTGNAEAVSVPAIALAAATFIFAMIETLPFVLVFGGTHGPVIPSAVFGVVAAGLASGAIATVLMLYVIKRTDSTTASTVAFLVPVVAIAAGIVFLGEHLAWYVPIGTVIILLGGALAQGFIGGRQPART